MQSGDNICFQDIWKRTETGRKATRPVRKTVMKPFSVKRKTSRSNRKREILTCSRTWKMENKHKSVWSGNHKLPAIHQSGKCHWEYIFRQIWKTKTWRSERKGTWQIKKKNLLIPSPEPSIKIRKSNRKREILTCSSSSKIQKMDTKTYKMGIANCQRLIWVENAIGRRDMLTCSSASKM